MDLNCLRVGLRLTLLNSFDSGFQTIASIEK